MTLQWNVKGATNVPQAVSQMRHGHQCKAVVTWRSDADRINQRKALNPVLQELKRLGSDEHYLAHGSTDYNECCLKHFSIAKRRGYVVLTFIDGEATWRGDGC